MFDIIMIIFLIIAVSIMIICSTPIGIYGLGKQISILLAIIGGIATVFVTCYLG